MAGEGRKRRSHSSGQLGRCLQHRWSCYFIGYGYQQIESNDLGNVRPRFNSHHGLYIYLKLSLCLKNASSMFHFAMGIIPSTVKSQFAPVYLDIFVSLLGSDEKNLGSLQAVMGLILRVCILLKMDKCFFFEDHMDYLGDLYQPCKLRISTKAATAIGELQLPINVTELKLFLSLCNVFRQLVQSFIHIGPSLSAKSEMDKPLQFGRLNQTESEALEMLQHGLLSTQILSVPMPRENNTLDTDACNKQFSCVS